MTSSRVVFVFAWPSRGLLFCVRPLSPPLRLCAWWSTLATGYVVSGLVASLVSSSRLGSCPFPVFGSGYEPRALFGVPPSFLCSPLVSSLCVIPPDLVWLRVWVERLTTSSCTCGEGALVRVVSAAIWCVPRRGSLSGVPPGWRSAWSSIFAVPLGAAVVSLTCCRRVLRSGV